MMKVEEWDWWSSVESPVQTLEAFWVSLVQPLPPRLVSASRIRQARKRHPRRPSGSWVPQVWMQLSRDDCAPWNAGWLPDASNWRQRCSPSSTCPAEGRLPTEPLVQTPVPRRIGAEQHQSHYAIPPAHRRSPYRPSTVTAYRSSAGRCIY